ncbi:MAG: glutathione reductase [Oscillospiraceae bacterium]|nr:glutathione reductase [Oscillospiraceae bacterium]
MKNINEFLKSKDIDILWEDHNSVLWVDHRDEDENIVKYTGEMLNIDNLSAEVIESENELGYEVIIIYGDKKSVVNFNPKKVSRDTTLIALNEILQPDSEVRFWMDSVGGDTLAFVPLSSVAWSHLEHEFGIENVRYHFAPIIKTSVMFEMSIDEMRAIVKERRL